MATDVDGVKDFVFFNGCVAQAEQAIGRYLRGEKPAQGGEQSFNLEHLEQIRDKLRYSDRAMRERLTYSETPPTKAGWYWRKEVDGTQEVRRVPDKNGAYPLPWRDARAEVLKRCEGLEPMVRNIIEASPLETWRVQWAGPVWEPL